MSTLLRLVVLARPQWRAFATVAVIGLCVSGLYVGVGIVLARAIDRTYRGEALADVTGLLGLAGGLLLLRAVAVWGYTRAAAAVAGDVKISLRERLYRTVLDLGPAWTGRSRTGEVQGMLTDGVDAVERVYSGLLIQTGVSFTVGVAIAGYIATVDPAVGAIVGIALLGMPAVVVLSRVALRGTGEMWWQTYGDLHSTYVDHLQGITTLKVLGAGRRRGQGLHRRALAFRDAAIATMGRESLFSTYVGVAAGIGGALSVGVGALHVADGTLGLADLLLILFLARECFRPLTDLTRGFHLAYYGIVVSRPMFDLLDSQPMVTDPPVRHAHSGDIPSRPAAGTSPAVVFEAVSFAYPGGDALVVGDLDLTVAAGETVALVGRSGAGKSTCALLLMRFYDPTLGRVTIGGRDIRDLPLALLRSQVALVAQDTHLFGGTVRENLQLADPGAREGELWRALDDASAGGFVRALPEGLDTVIGDRGVKLSGGQRQRLSIARALLKDAPILVLDEATSSLDVANEADIQQAVERLRRGRTTLVIAHRLSTVQGADRVVVLDRGRIVEQGPPGVLGHGDGAYARLLATQLGGVR